MDEKVKFDIIEGPDRMSLFHAFANGLPILFRVRKNGGDGSVFYHDIVISSIERESGDGHSWNIVGTPADNKKLLGNLTGFYKTNGKPNWGKDILGHLHYAVRDEW